MAIDEAEAGTAERPEDIEDDARGVVRRWRSELGLADREERPWRDDAARVLRLYRGAVPADRLRYNIMRSNIQTVRPALFNSVPVPDVRQRFGEGDELTKHAARVLERALTVLLDDGRFADAMTAAVHDRTAIGRGVARVRYEPELDEAGNVVSQSCHIEHVVWDRFRRGPGATWDEVRWVAFRHSMTRDDLVAQFGEAGNDVSLNESVEKVEAKPEDGKDIKGNDLFRRACVWEVWDKDARRVLFIAEGGYDSAPLKEIDDPLKLSGFFPIPHPMYWLLDSASLVPVAEYPGYEALADEANEITRRIAGLVKVIRWRGAYDEALGELGSMADLDDGQLQPVRGAQAWADKGGFDRAIWLWPISEAIAVLRELYMARENVKQAIYEMTGVADVMRGSTDPDETLGAQQMKAQFGSQRVMEAQRDVERFARDLIRIKAEIIAEHYQPQVLEQMTGLPVPPEVRAVLASDAMRSWRIDIETDSTIQADMSRAQQNVGGFMSGFSQFMQAVGPAVESGLFPVESAADLLASFSRMFKLGRQAEDAIERVGQQAKQQQGQPQQPDPKQIAAQAEAAKAQVAQASAQADMAKMQMEMQAAKAEHEQKMQEIAAKTQQMMIKAKIDMQRLRNEAAMLQVEAAMPKQPAGDDDDGLGE